MASFAIQTTDDPSKPNREAFGALVGENGRRPIATIGWSYADELDLRKLEVLNSKKALKGKAARKAWGGHQFYDQVQMGDLLFYRDLPAQGRFTLVEVTGNYGYLKKSPTGDFRSFRPCKVLKEDVLIADPSVGAALRKYLKLPRRIFEIPSHVGEKFLDRTRSPNDGPQTKSKKKKGASDLDQMKKQFFYSVGRHEVEVNLWHREYQKRLKAFLKAQRVQAEFEKNYVDVSFSLGSDLFLGEVKLTNWLTIGEAFRIALGQILDYDCLGRTKSAGLVIFLDQEVKDRQRIELATRLGVAIVFERDSGIFILQNPEVNALLKELFKT